MMKRSICLPYKSYRGKYYPIIRIVLRGPRGSLESEAYVDSGASVSIFLPAIAKHMGIEDITQGKVSYTMVGNGNHIPVYLHKLSLKIGHRSFRATIGFSWHLGADFNLLGQEDVFDQFAITFDKRHRTISFKPY